MAFVKVASTADIAPGSAKCVEVEGKQIALFNVDGAFHAIDNLCRHRQGPLAEGEIDGTLVTCPWHGWQYDVTTGQNVLDDDEPVARYDVRVDGDAILVDV